jgi:AcrR family transcriptional regulator
MDRHTPTPTAPPRRFSGAERKRQILEEAARAFATAGFAGTTTRSIATECGISEAALYKYFRSKEELFESALRSKIESYDIEGFLDGLSDEGPLEDTFRAVAQRILDVGLKDPTVHRLLLAASVSGTERTGGLYVSWRMPFVSFLENLVRKGVEEGRIRPVDPLLTARAFVGLVMDCVLSCDLWGKLGYPGYTPGALVENNVPTFVRGLVAAPDGPEKERES